MKNTTIIAGVAISLAVIGGWAFLFSGNSADERGASVPAQQKTASIIMPELSQQAQSGEIAFNRFCAECHGENLAGTDQGPSFLNAIYRPGHHGDAAFARAPRTGVVAHHWRFGNMPKIEGVSDAQLRWITLYVREMQQANGIR